MELKEFIMTVIDDITGAIEDEQKKCFPDSKIANFAIKMLLLNKELYITN